MTPLAKEIVEEAYRWYERDCFETTRNRGACIDNIHEEFGEEWAASRRRDAYCAKFVTIVLDEAFKKFNAKNPIVTARAATMLDLAVRNLIPITDEPNVGSIFYKKSSAPGASGHVGIVVKNIDGVKFATIEGNAPDPKTGKEGVVSIIRSRATDRTLQFIQIQNRLGNESLPLLASFNPILSVVLLGVAFYAYKQYAGNK